MRSTAFVLVCVFVGTILGAILSKGVAQPPQEFLASYEARTWQQDCVYAGRADSAVAAQEITRAVRARGESGWELVSVTDVGTQSAVLACFKRSMPRTP